MVLTQSTGGGLKLALFGNTSFLNPHIRVGLQHLAFEWAKLGHEIDYFSCPTHPLDFISPSRRALWKRAWLGRGGHQVAPNLVEYFLRAPFSRRRQWWVAEAQAGAYSCLFPARFINKRYDACISDVCYSALNVPKVSATRFILRLNDNPEGYQHHMSPLVVNWFKNQLKNNRVDAVWPVSQALAEWALRQNANLCIEMLPNGVALDAYRQEGTPDQIQPLSAAYLGTFQPWFDWETLRDTATRLPSWHIDLYGPIGAVCPPSDLPHNVNFMGPVPYDRVPEILGRYEVGLLPFKPSGNFLDFFDPLKAYQYWAAGLGIAATNIGRMADALLPWACLGSDPDSFAAAIVEAGRQRQVWRQDENLRKRLDESNWSSLAIRALSGMMAS